MTTEKLLRDDEEFKEIIDYRDGSQCCENCRHFRGTDMSGNIGALDSHCRSWFPVLIRVKSTGVCNGWEAKL